MWQAKPLKDYLELLKREGFNNSTIAMHRSSNLRFCKYLQEIGINDFCDISQTILKNFNHQDLHTEYVI